MAKLTWVYKIGIFACKLCLCSLFLHLGVDIINESGERVYLKYMHAARKMYLPHSKPGDKSIIPSQTWNEFSLSIINLMGAFMVSAGAILLAGRKELGCIFLINAILIMMATKDNPFIKSDVAAINREKDLRMEWFMTDVSLLGVCLILAGGMAAPFWR